MVGAEARGGLACTCREQYCVSHCDLIVWFESDVVICDQHEKFVRAVWISPRSMMIRTSTVFRVQELRRILWDSTRNPVVDLNLNGHEKYSFLFDKTDETRTGSHPMASSMFPFFVTAASTILEPLQSTLRHSRSGLSLTSVPTLSYSSWERPRQLPGLSAMSS